MIGLHVNDPEDYEHRQWTHCIGCGVTMEAEDSCTDFGPMCDDCYCGDCDLPIKALRYGVGNDLTPPYRGAEWTGACCCHDRSEEDYGDYPFADPGGRSSLRAAGPDNPRNIPCPTCGRPDMLTPEDRKRGYQCDYCADAAEGYGP